MGLILSMKVFGLPSDYYAKYEGIEEEDTEFLFDSTLELERQEDPELEDRLVAAELLRPERLDTVEEVSEPVTSGGNSQHGSLPWQLPPDSQQGSQQGSLPWQLPHDTDPQDRSVDRSLTEQEFRNSLRSQPGSGQHSLPGLAESSQILRSQLSDDRSIAQIEQVGKQFGLQPEQLTYHQNPFEIFERTSEMTTVSVTTKEESTTHEKISQLR